MKIKKYLAPSMPEAMQQIRADLGSDAVILNSKIVQTGGFLGFFRKKKIEVIAAIDPMPKKVPEQVVKVKQPLKNVKVADSEQVNQSVLLPKQPDKKLSVNGEEQVLLKEITELKKLMKNMHVNGRTSSVIYPDVLQKIASVLDEQEIAPTIKEELMNDLVEKWFTVENKPEFQEVSAWAKQLLVKRISHVQYGEISYQKKFVNVVGPTGVGKTTTLAKLAATAVLKDKKRAAFITTDTYRIAAIDQLKTYAKILCVPLEVCYTIEDFQHALEKFNKYDVVFIDTAGRNFRNKQYVEDLQEMIQFDDQMETFLVLSLTSKLKDMEEIYEQFSMVDIQKLIFTKVDETANYGAIVNMIEKYNVGVAYLTNGQDVPDDIFAVNPDVIMNTIFGD